MKSVESTQGASMKIFCLECGRKSKKSKKKKMKEKNHTEEFSSGVWVKVRKILENL